MLTVGQRVSYAFTCFFSLLFTGRIPAELLAVVGAAPPPPVAPGPAPAAAAPQAAAEDPGDRAVQLLALLQRDGRLVDFLREDLAGYSDAQVGAAVRDVHRNCRQVLDTYAPVEPILPDEEGRPTVVSAPVDPSTVTLIGNVRQQASYRGTLRHRGWRVGRLALPPLPAPAARLVVAPAEVDID